MSSWVPLKINSIDFKFAKLVYKPELVIEASSEAYFDKLPDFEDVIEILSGDDVNETKFEFKSGFAVVKGSFLFKQNE